MRFHSFSLFVFCPGKLYRRMTDSSTTQCNKGPWPGEHVDYVCQHSEKNEKCQHLLRCCILLSHCLTLGVLCYTSKRSVQNSHHDKKKSYTYYRNCLCFWYKQPSFCWSYSETTLLSLCSKTTTTSRPAWRSQHKQQ